MSAHARRAASGASQPTGEADPKVDRLDTLVRLWGLIARSGAPQLKLRVTGALSLTFLGKVLGVAAPLMLGAAVNRLAAGQGAGAQAALMFAAMAGGWAATRFLASAAPQLRDLVFAPVGQAAQNRAATEAFDHAMSLSLDYHQGKRTGALARVIDRGSKAVETLLETLVFNLAPTVVELILAAAVLPHANGARQSMSRLNDGPARRPRH